MRRHFSAFVLCSLSFVWLAAASAQQPVVPAAVRAAADRITTEQVTEIPNGLVRKICRGLSIPEIG